MQSRQRAAVALEIPVQCKKRRWGSTRHIPVLSEHVSNKNELIFNIAMKVVTDSSSAVSLMTPAPLSLMIVYAYHRTAMHAMGKFHCSITNVNPPLHILARP